MNFKKHPDYIRYNDELPKSYLFKNKYQKRYNVKAKYKNHKKGG